MYFNWLNVNNIKLKLLKKNLFFCILDSIEYLRLYVLTAILKCTFVEKYIKKIVLLFGEEKFPSIILWRMDKQQNTIHPFIPE